MSDYSTEVTVRVYSDDTGDCIEVRPDSDGLGLLGLRYLDGPEELGALPNVPRGHLRNLAWAILTNYPDEETSDDQ